MLHVFVVGAAAGILGGVGKWLLLPTSSEQAVSKSLIQTIDSETGSKPSRRTLRSKCSLAVVTAASTGAAYVAYLLLRQQRSNKSGSCTGRSRRDLNGRIPLPDLIRFKERQWFVEELENARDADPNAMLRLAKMYLHGQGCQQNIALAQEWVRKARNMGVPATLDELFATDDPDPRTRLRTLAAAEERRRALRRLGSAHPQQHRAAAA